jgi:hypothetical protein
MIFPHSIICVALVAALSLSASPSAQAQTPETMSLQFMTFPLAVEPLEVEMLVGEGKTIKIKVPSNELSDAVRIPLMGSLVFGETVLDEKKKPTFKIYGEGKPAAAPKQLVLLLRKGKEMADGFEVRAIPCDIQAFGGGKIMFVNATKVEIGGQIGHKPFALKPNAHTIIKPSLEANGRLTYVELSYNQNGKAVPFFNTLWPVADNYRGLVFFYHDPNNENKIQLHSFRDFLGVNE